MSREVMQQALKALEIEDMACRYEKEPTPEHIAKAITALQEKLAQPDFWEGYVPEPVKPAQQEPVAYIHRQGNHYEVSERFLSDDEKSRGWTEEPLYTSPPAQRTWEEWFKWWRTSKVADSTEAEIDFADFMLIVRAVESEYGIKENT